MSVYILRHLGVSRSEAGHMPAWERNLLVRRHKEALGINESPPPNGGIEASGGFTADEVRALTTSSAVA